MKIRQLRDFDKVGLCKLSHQINREHFENEPTYFCNPGQVGGDWEFWKKSHEKEGGCILVAILNNDVVGFIAAELSDMPNLPFLNPMKRCRISTIVVSNEHQRKGIGTALFNAVKKIAEDNCATDINLEVLTFNDSAVAFYERLGFKTNASRMAFMLK